MSGAPPVVLVHGFATDSERTWRETGWVDLLADEGREVICVDLLGHGDAERPHDPAAYEQLATHAAAQLPADAVDAVGFSLGAEVLVEIALAEPTRFRRLVLAGVGDSLLELRDGEAAARSLEAPTEPADPGLRHLRALASAGGGDPAALAACLRRTRRPPSTEDLARIDLPVLVLLGTEDFQAPADRLVAALPRAELHHLPGVDHFATPRSFACIDAALAFLDAGASTS